MQRVSQIVLLLSLALTFGANADGLKLAPDATVVLLPAKPDDEEAKGARLLQEWLRKVYRSKGGFAVLTEDNAGQIEGKNVIALGRAQRAVSAGPARLSRDGFVIKSRGNSIIIRGGSAAGTFYGVCGFLDKFCGVRFYMPGELFTSLSARTAVEVPETEIVEQPYVRNCMMSGAGARPGERDWLQRNAALRKDFPTHQHSMWQRFPPERFAAKYPEIYPTLNNRRYVPSDSRDQKWQPCLSEPKLLDAAEESAINFFKEKPEANHIAFSVQDSHAFCQCPRCQEQIARAGGNKVAAYSLMNANFLNALATRLERSLPAHGIAADKTIVYIAYSEVRETPPFKLHQNVMPVAVFKIGDILIDKLMEPDSNVLDRWAAVAGQMGNHDWGQGMGYFIPRYYTGLTSRFFRYAKQKGIAWGYQHFEAYPNWGFDGPKLYITARIWWDPDVDVADLWRQLCADLFPRAAEPMRQYFLTLEDLWIKMDNDAERKMKKWTTQFGLSAEQQQMVAQCRKLLHRAAELAADGREKRRIELFSKTFRLAEYFFDIANAPTVAPAKVEELRRYAREVIAPDPMTVFEAPKTDALMESVEQALKVIVARRPAK